MLPRLQAEDQLAAVNTTVVASLMRMEPKDAGNVVAELARVVEGTENAPRAAATATPEGLAAIGIGTMIVEASHG